MNSQSDSSQDDQTPDVPSPTPTPDAQGSAEATPPPVDAAPAAPKPDAKVDAAGVAKEMDASLEKMDKKKPVDVQDLQRKKGATPGGGGDPLPGSVVRVEGNDVFVELGPRMQGMCSLSDFAQPPAVGDSHEFMLRGKGEGELLILGLRQSQATINWDEVAVGSEVEAGVVGQNTGGLELKLGALSGFMPASHVELGRVEDLGVYIGQKLTCKVIEVDKKRRRVLVSRKAILEKGAAAERKVYLKGLAPGSIVEGVVRRFETFGAFVELRPGVEGLLHVSNISRKRVNKPEDALKVGQKVECAVLEIKNGGRRIGLGMKQLEPNPWDTLEQRCPEDSELKGTVKRITDFGAFVEVEEGIEGLVHISQLSPERIRTVSEAVKEGEQIDVRVLSVDGMNQRLSLSRLNNNGRVIGSPDADEPMAEGAAAAPNKRGGGGGAKKRSDRRGDDKSVPSDVVRNQDSGKGTNLGSLLRRALGDD